MPGGVTYGQLENLSFTEAEMVGRGTANAWGAGWVFASGGLQRDIIMAAEEFDTLKRDGLAPSASGSANLGAVATPIKRADIMQVVAGSPDVSGHLFMYGGPDTQDGGNLALYEIVVDSGSLSAKRVPAIYSDH